MSSYCDKSRDPRLTGRYNDGPPTAALPSATAGLLSSESPKQNGPTTAVPRPNGHHSTTSPRPSGVVKPSINPKTFSYTTINDTSMFHIEFYRAFKSFEAAGFTPEIQENMTKCLKAAFDHFQKNEKAFRHQLEESRRITDDLRDEFNEKVARVLKMESDHAATQKELEEQKAVVTAMKHDTNRYKIETEKARHDCALVTTEKNNLIKSITEEKDRHKTTEARYNALNAKYGDLFRENGTLKKENAAFKDEKSKLQQKMEDDAKENDETQGILYDEIEQLKKENEEIKKELSSAKENAVEPVSPKLGRGKPVAAKKKAAEKDDDDEVEEKEEPAPSKRRQRTSVAASKKKEEPSTSSQPRGRTTAVAAKKKEEPSSSQPRRRTTAVAAKKKEEEPSSQPRRRTTAVAAKKKEEPSSSQPRQRTSAAAKKKEEKLADEEQPAEEKSATPKSRGRPKKIVVEEEKAVEEEPKADNEAEETEGKVGEEESPASGRPSRKAKSDSMKRTSKLFAPSTSSKRASRGKRAATPAAVEDGNNNNNDEEEEVSHPPPAKRGRKKSTK